MLKNCSLHVEKFGKTGPRLAAKYWKNLQQSARELWLGKRFIFQQDTTNIQPELRRNGFKKNTHTTLIYRSDLVRVQSSTQSRVLGKKTAVHMWYLSNRASAVSQGIFFTVKMSESDPHWFKAVFVAKGSDTYAIKYLCSVQFEKIWYFFLEEIHSELMVEKQSNIKKSNDVSKTFL